MSSGEFSQWIKYFEIEPFGAYRDNFHTGTIAAILANVNRGKNGRSYSVNDFMYKDQTTQRDERHRQFLAKLNARAEPKDG